MSAPDQPPPTPILRDTKDGLQRVRPSPRQWNDAAEARFLDTLAATCNVTAAAAASGFSKTLCYARRRTDAAFAAQWQCALDQGYAALEAELLRAATQPPAAAAPDRGADRPRFADMTVREAILVLQLHRGAVRGGRQQRYDWRPRPKTVEDLREEILRRLDLTERARRRRPPAPE